MDEKPLKEIKVRGSDGERVYHVRIFETFDECDCAGFGYRKKCRHSTIARKVYNRELAKEKLAGMKTIAEEVELPEVKETI